jgi:hypothetical protein
VALTADRDHSAATLASAGARLGTARSQPSVSRVPSAQRPDGGLARKPRRGAPMPYLRFQGPGSRLHSRSSTALAQTLGDSSHPPDAGRRALGALQILQGSSCRSAPADPDWKQRPRADVDAWDVRPHPWCGGLAPISRVLQAALAFVGASRVPAPACRLRVRAGPAISLGARTRLRQRKPTSEEVSRPART